MFVGACYELGMFTKQDNTQAFAWYKKAAEHGNAQAQNNLGRMYDKGISVDQNQEQKQVRGKPHLLLIKPILTDRAIKNRNTKKEEK
jgi:TPR repeat protein